MGGNIMKMTNRDLYKKILCELGNKYKIGLHESTKFTYKFRKNFDEIYDMSDSVVNEDEIILNILRKVLVYLIELLVLRVQLLF